MNTNKHLGLLGFKIEDKVTGLKGVVTSISFDLYGCIQALIVPTSGNTAEVFAPVWLDVARLKPKSKKPIIQPDHCNTDLITRLGFNGEDLVTGFKGVIVTLCFNLTGPAEISLKPGVDDDGKPRNSGPWMDANRIKIKGKKPVMPVPDFNLGYIAEGRKGPAEKPTIDGADNNP